MRLNSDSPVRDMTSMARILDPSRNIGIFYTNLLGLCINVQALEESLNSWAGPEFIDATEFIKILEDHAMDSLKDAEYTQSEKGKLGQSHFRQEEKDFLIKKLLVWMAEYYEQAKDYPFQQNGVFGIASKNLPAFFDFVYPKLLFILEQDPEYAALSRRLEAETKEKFIREIQMENSRKTDPEKILSFKLVTVIEKLTTEYQKFEKVYAENLAGMLTPYIPQHNTVWHINMLMLGRSQSNELSRWREAPDILASCLRKGCKPHIKGDEVAAFVQDFLALQSDRERFNSVCDNSHCKKSLPEPTFIVITRGLQKK